MASDRDQRRRGKPVRDLVLSALLKALRRHRGMTSAEVADGMGLDTRTYERFEAGEGHLRVERIFRFAAVTDSDPYALLAAVKSDDSELAVVCADNKLIMLLVAHVRELHREMGAEVRRLQPQRIIEALGPAFAALRAELEAGRTLTDQWLGRTSPNDDEASD